MTNKQIKTPERVFGELDKLKDTTLSILEKMKDTAETRKLREKLQNCDDAVEFLEIVTEISQKALIQMKGNKYLTEDEVENLKDACDTEDDKSIVRDLTDSGMRFKDTPKGRRM